MRACLFRAPQPMLPTMIPLRRARHLSPRKSHKLYRPLYPIDQCLAKGSSHLLGTQALTSQENRWRRAIRVQASLGGSAYVAATVDLGEGDSSELRQKANAEFAQGAMVRGKAGE